GAPKSPPFRHYPRPAPLASRVRAGLPSRWRVRHHERRACRSTSADCWPRPSGVTAVPSTPNPTTPTPYTCLASLSISREITIRLPKYRAGRHLNLGNAAYHANLGEAHRALGDLECAAECCRTALRLQQRMGTSFTEKTMRAPLVIAGKAHDSND